MTDFGDMGQQNAFFTTKLSLVLSTLREKLENEEIWDSLLINRRKPHTYRVFTYLEDGFRICLHKFDLCRTDEAFLHPHPWPGAFKILKGRYAMDIGHSLDRTSNPIKVMSVVLPAGSLYTITSPLTWHSVIPLETTYSVMINGKPWDTTYAHEQVRTTAGKDLDKMPKDELREFLNLFKGFLDKENEHGRHSISGAIGDKS